MHVHANHPSIFTTETDQSKLENRTLYYMIGRSRYSKNQKSVRDSIKPVQDLDHPRPIYRLPEANTWSQQDRISSSASLHQVQNIP